MQSLRINNRSLPRAYDERHPPPESRNNFVVLGGECAAATSFGRSTVPFSREKEFRPIDVLGVKVFTGMVNYCGRLINYLSDFMEPMYKLLKKGQTFEWTKECKEAFQMIASENILVHYVRH